MAAVSCPPSLTEGEMLAARRRRRGARAPSAAARHGSERITSTSSYKVLKKIGEGAFGSVSKARDLRTGEVVAIKSAIGSSGRSAGEAEAAAAALLREAALLAACGGGDDNSAVVALREVARGEDTGELHLVMEYVGPSLDAVIAARRRGKHPFTEDEARRVMAQLLAGAGSMHARGVVHRDLKPGNVLVGERDGRVRICDLGLARSSFAAPPRPPVDGPPQHEGTPGYIAPEVLLCEEGCGDGGAPVDMWALGCVMAELVAGEKLLPADNLYQQLIDIVDLLGIPDDVSLMPLGIAAAAPSKLREKVPEERLSPAGFDVLRGLLEYDPKDRLTAAAALQMPWFSAKDD